jgi:serine/threonine-protein kinase RsbT
VQVTTSMSSNDTSDEIVGVLRSHFSAPIARALLTSTLRRAKLAHDPIERRGMPAAIAALEEVLPNYISDPAKRSECVRGLRMLVVGATVVAAPPPSAPPRPASSSASTATIIHIRTPDDALNACEAARDIARKVGFSDVDQVKVATATAELTRNILLYAKVGELRVASLDAPRRGIEIEATDNGPGIGDVDLVMSDRYRSRSGMGMGLKGTRRLTDVFDLATSPKGTRVLARKFVK